MMRRRDGDAYPPTPTARPRPASAFTGGFDDRFDALAAIAYRVAFRVRGDRTEAEDIAQETLARALVRWTRIAGHAEAWTATTAGNLAISAWRHQQRSDRRAGELRSTARTSAVPPESLPLDRIELVAHLARLPRRQREVVVLRYVADLPEASVADALGCSIGTVKRHAHRGLGALRLALDPTAGPPAATAPEGAPRRPNKEGPP